MNTDHLSPDSYPESSELPVDDEPDSLSRSTETASTVIDALRNAPAPRGSSQDLGDKTDDELDEMESETGDQSIKPSRMEDVSVYYMLLLKEEWDISMLLLKEEWDISMLLIKEDWDTSMLLFKEEWDTCICCLSVQNLFIST